MLLAIDTSTARIGLALYDGIQVTAEQVWLGTAHHTQELAPALSGLLARCGLTIDSLQALGVAIGPGSFTSLRVGLALAKGLALARHLPLVGVPTLDVVARAVPLAGQRLAAVLQAGRGRLALGWYRDGEDGWQADGPVRVTTAEELAARIRRPTIICGELTAADQQRLRRRFKNVSLSSPAESVRRPGILAEIAWQRWQAGQTDETAGLAPIYLHVAGGPPA
ncbi:MAG: tRNA (adenosine(37)-N6)-threonylcarbamoyltransferase complex dimerization subunit type 1 TsaB [Anaerolineales bacterium]|nr:tRNA (adenosine(37)-N6)-threonylcarbamoyltransferase complex dimerization subunit type 1 TsaB [Anaerolineales bacterium]